MADRKPAPPTEVTVRNAGQFGPAPRPAPSVPLWRRLAQFTGLDDEIDALSAAGRVASDWIDAQLPAQSPEGRARWNAIDQQLREGEAARTQRQHDLLQAITDPLKRAWQ